jgi:hypothetical protein
MKITIIDKQLPAQVSGKNISVNDINMDGNQSIYINQYSELYYSELYYNERKLIFDKNDNINLFIMLNIFFNKNNLLKEFDCTSFIHYFKQIPYIYTMYDQYKWDENEYKENKLNTGDVIAMKLYDECVHFAIYLCNGLYISKLGGNGSVVVTNIKQLEIAYPCNKIITLTKRELYS